MGRMHGICRSVELAARVNAFLTCAGVFALGCFSNSDAADAGASSGDQDGSPGTPFIVQMSADSGTVGIDSPPGVDSSAAFDAGAGSQTDAQSVVEADSGSDAALSVVIDAGSNYSPPTDRSTVWKPGVTYNGGIPARLTACANLTPSGDKSGATDQTNITNAITACPAGQAVLLAAGSYYISATSDPIFLKSNVTIRGAVDSAGRPATRLLHGNRSNSLFTDFNMGGGNEGDYVDAELLTTDGASGSYSVQVAAVPTNPGYTAGELVTINQVYDDSLWYNTSHFGTDCAPVSSADGVAATSGAADTCASASPGTEMNRNLFTQWNHPIGQILEISSVTGKGPYTLTFTTPLHSAFTVANQAHVLRHGYYGTHATAITVPDQWIGIENIYSEGGGNFVDFINVKYSWVKNCEVFDWDGQAISFTRSFRSEERDSFVHQTMDPNPGGGGYALALDWQSSDNLIENNIHWAANKVIVMRSSGGGNVIGYNYFMDGFGAGYPTIPEAGLNATHYVGSHMELFEGNESWNLWADPVWGTSSNVTFFRNHSTGLRRGVAGVTSVGSTGTPMNFDNDSGGRVMVAVTSMHDNYTFIDNVLGSADQLAPASAWSYDTTSLTFVTPSIWDVGTDQGTGATLAMYQLTVQSCIRHGNWDYGFTNGVVWDPQITVQTFTDSLYLESAPAFWSSWKGQQGTGPYGGSWPWVDGTTGTTETLPARAAFDAMLQAGTLYCKGAGMPTPCCGNSQTCQ